MIFYYKISINGICQLKSESKIYIRYLGLQLLGKTSESYESCSHRPKWKHCKSGKIYYLYNYILYKDK